jgi:hypothetical protein
MHMDDRESWPIRSRFPAAGSNDNCCVKIASVVVAMVTVMVTVMAMGMSSSNLRGTVSTKRREMTWLGRE